MKEHGSDLYKQDKFDDARGCDADLSHRVVAFV